MNVNPETGIRYGIISSLSLEDGVIDDIYSNGTDVYYEEAVEEIRADLQREIVEGNLHENDFEDELENRVNAFNNEYEPDEPVYKFSIEGVEGRTTWLGGALMVWIFKSPFTTQARLCSPCVPNCGDLNNIDLQGALCYDVPPDWRIDTTEELA